MTNQPKILLIDDEDDILEILEYNLRKEGFLVFTATNGAEGLEKARVIKPDLIILDIMMPEMDGIETCKHLRAINELRNTVITFLTARNEDYSQLAGFEVGADDFIAKPIKPAIFISRIKALLRRMNIQVDNLQPLVVNAGNFKIDRERHLVSRNGENFHLPRKQFDFISLLASKPQKVFTREEILATVWGNDMLVNDRSIDVHIRKIREKLGDDSIKTIKGVGYKMEE